MFDFHKAYRNCALCGVSVLALSAAPALAEEAVLLPGITIYSTVPLLPSENLEDPDSPNRPPVTGDPGEFLRHVNGVDAGRMGGHGLEVSIRGLDQNQLNITNDGAFHFGGCPNRMDPPTSHMQLYSYDKVTVKKGVVSVLDGPPAPGGTVAFERDILNFGPEGGFRVKTGGGYTSNGNKWEGFADAATGNEWGYVRGFATAGRSGNYKDGSGNEVRSGFKQFGGGLIVARTFDSDSWITLKVENNNVDDVLFPGSGMDAPTTDDWTFQAKMATDLDWGVIRGVKGDIYLTTVDHVMNNFDLRTQLPGTGYFEAVVDSNTLGGKLVFNGALGGITFDAGFSYRDVMRDGTKYGGPFGTTNPTLISSVLWGDTSIKEYGLFAEAVAPLGAATKATLGVRYSHVNASMKDGDVASTFGPAPGRTANMAFTSIYGNTANKDRTENNVSGLLRLEHSLGGGLTLFGSASRSVRTADASERYISNFMGSPATCGAAGCSSWVGNPDIKPEKHHQIDFGARYKSAMVDLSGSVYFNRITDFIQLYKGVAVDATYTNASIYRNIRADLMGAEGEAEIRLTSRLRANLAAAYTYGKNRTAGTPLAQVAPLSGKFELTYDAEKWMGGFRINAAAKQNRTDAASSGIDAGPTKAYATLDLFGAYNLTDKFQVSAGVTNLLDKTYAHHINKSNLLDPAVLRVNEPGRSFYLRATASF